MITDSDRPIIAEIRELFSTGPFWIEAMEQDGDDTERLTVSHGDRWFTVRVEFGRDSRGVGSSQRKERSCAYVHPNIASWKMIPGFTGIEVNARGFFLHFGEIVLGPLSVKTEARIPTEKAHD